MKIIYKYEIKLEFGLQKIELPFGAEILSVQMQADSLCIWALINPKTNVKTIRIIDIIATGIYIHDIKKFQYHNTFIGTVQYEGYVFHVFISNE